MRKRFRKSRQKHPESFCRLILSGATGCTGSIIKQEEPIFPVRPLKKFLRFF